MGARGRVPPKGEGGRLAATEEGAEAPVREADLRRHGFHRLLEPQAFEAGLWELDQPLDPPSAEPLAADGAAVAAQALVALAEKRSAVPIDAGAAV